MAGKSGVTTAVGDVLARAAGGAAEAVSVMSILIALNVVAPLFQVAVKLETCVVCWP